MGQDFPACWTRLRHIGNPVPDKTTATRAARANVRPRVRDMVRLKYTPGRGGFQAGPALRLLRSERRSLAFSATMTVETDMSTAPRAGVRSPGAAVHRDPSLRLYHRAHHGLVHPQQPAHSVDVSIHPRLECPPRERG